eukprot:CAMPEP_0177655338 /NCGR_PEP_ID=MMETSP0447-20121125/14904_1 /TAXON_ID=0 /ORGANISM="Stygamoeba regulata, Strain BSH-02190019" /LENGTH=541 /DNA_ID=CAMNT_0019159231 /DNA_START=187 /DNA_END=1812 /DNA_ORIENTATION=+
MEENVTIVEPIEKRRQPFPNLEAVYFLSPSIDSIAALNADFDPEAPVQYAAAHIFLTSRLPKTLFSKISPSIAAKAKTFVEANLEFLAPEAQVFDLGMENTVRDLFHPKSEGDFVHASHVISTRLASLCVTLGEDPYIRYAKHNPNGAALAQQVQKKLAQMTTGLKNWHAPSKRTTLLILDRTIDAVAPLLHEFTYQAMMHDLLGIKGIEYEHVFQNALGGEERSTVLLNENDRLYCTLRHVHIGECSKHLVNNFNEFVRNNQKILNSASGQAASLKEMSEMIQKLPQFQELKNKYSLHLDIATKCMAAFHERKMMTVAALEQNMATGEDEDGKKVKKIKQALLPVLSDSEVKKEDKQRLIMIYMATQKGDSMAADVKELVAAANLSAADQTCVNNFSKLIGTMERVTVSKKKDSSKKDDDVPFVLSRYTPILKGVLQALAEGELPATTYPFVDEKQAVDFGNSAPKKKTKSLKTQVSSFSNRDKVDDGDRDRIIVFIGGGAAPSELRTCYEISSESSHDVILGHTAMLTPQLLMEELKKM